MRRHLLSFLDRLWQASPSLTGTGLLMLPILAAAVVGLGIDERLITGAPAWLKPAKFAASIAIYTLSLAWIFTYLPAWVRMRRTVGRVSAVVFIMEIAIIALQAWRGTTSHFNVATPLDAALFSAMGIGILVQTLASVAVAVALWRQTFADRATGWALRLGLTLTIIGAVTGGLMTRPTAEQLAQAQVTRITVAGAHTVGAPDGGPGLPGTGWSVEHGDLRVPHFLGLHALQAFALILLALPRGWRETRRVRMLFVGVASYIALFAIVLWQALNGEPLVTPSATTLSMLAAWAFATVATGLFLAKRPEAAPAPHAAVC